MTTHTVFGIAGPFNDQPEERLEAGTEFVLVEKATREPLILPAGNVVIEVSISRRGDSGDITDDLTPGRGISVGIDNDPRLFLGTPGAITDELNTFDTTPDNEFIPYTYFMKVDPATAINNMLRSDTRDRTFVLQSSFGGNVTSGGVSVVIKYKPFSVSVVDRYGNP